ncbi:hypothetical protein DUI87_20558 [Hirundo rustica rustica]|uniref:Uncharacterized protein n=1 Tax=Hirundo rustica rustica TaxID=333673 RepID=A0A3M0JQR5_HIRRU|nr:hypothetical protein DUI87_20558 [Hirundo rustica rustica]
MTPPSQKPRLEQPQGTTSLMDTQNPHRGNMSHCPAASPGEEAPTTLLAPAPAPSLFRSEAIPTHDPVSFWKEVKQRTVASGDIERAERISVPMSLPSSEDWLQGGKTVAAFRVHKGADFTGQIQAMVSAPTPPVTIPAKIRIAQLIPFKSSVPKTDSRDQRDQGFVPTEEP